MVPGDFVTSAPSEWGLTRAAGTNPPLDRALGVAFLGSWEAVDITGGVVCTLLLVESRLSTTFSILPVLFPLMAAKGGTIRPLPRPDVLVLSDEAGREVFVTTSPSPASVSI